MSNSGQVICMASVKGGSGKTVLAATFGTILSQIGKRVLLVDTDAATNGLTLLYLNEVVQHRENLPPTEGALAGTYELPGEAVTPTTVSLSDNMSLLPATYRFFDSETVDVDLYRETLRVAARQWREEFDFVFLDAQAGSDGFAYGAMRKEVSDQVILVSEYDPLSAAGIERLKALFAEDLSYERIWILLNKMLPDIAAKYGEFLEVARYLPPITWNADVVRAYSRRRLALDLQYGNEFTVAVCRTLAAWVDPLTQEELDSWLSDKAAELRTPLGTQVADLRRELAAVSSLSEHRAQRQAFISLLVIAMVLMLTVAAFIFAAIDAGGGGGMAAAVAAVGAIVASASVFWMDRQRSPNRASARETGLRKRLAALETLVELTDSELIARGGAEQQVVAKERT